MQVTGLAEVLVSARRPDGAISREELELRLYRAGLEEFVRAVASLAQRVRTEGLQESDDGPRMWF